MRAHREIDPLARGASVALAAIRISIGLGALLATRPSLRALGFPEPDGPTRALGRLAGGRDIALGTLTLIARDDRQALRAVVVASAGADLVDALSLGLAASREESMDPRVALGALSGAAATAAGIWTARRL